MTTITINNEDYEIVNLTPHDVVLMDSSDNIIVTIPSSGVARAEQSDLEVNKATINGKSFSLVVPSYGDVVDLPEYDGDTMYIVSKITADATAGSGRYDLLGTAGLVRNEKGQIIGCRGLCIYHC